MTPHDRELGSLNAQLASEIHARRNMKMVIDHLNTEIVELRVEVDRLKTTIRTTVAVVAAVAAASAWLVEIALRAP